MLSTLFLCALAAPAQAAGWGDWWLPKDYSVHGPAMDRLFIWIFWISMIVLVIVWALLIYFCIKYRSRPDRKKAIYSQGNIKLEMAWTLAPAVILIFIALVTKRVWDNYRYAPHAKDADPANIMVIGQQFKWNVIYAGPDKKLGRYLMYPKPTDLKWPFVPEADRPYEFPKDAAGKEVPGPAFLPHADAVAALNKYIDAVNPLGKDFADAEGADDDWVKTPGRDLEIPKGRPLDIHLSSRDVIHDFFLPNFRVKLDAVPGLRGRIYFTATTSSADLEQASRQKYPIEALQKLLSVKNPPTYRLVVPKDDPKADLKGTEGDPDAFMRYSKTVMKKKRIKGKVQDVEEKETLASDGMPLSLPMLEEMKANGFTELNAVRPATFDIVCEELCGSGHTTMKGTMAVLEPDVYRKKYETRASTPPAEAPVAGGAEMQGAE